MWIHNAQLMLQVTFTLSVLNLTCMEQKLLPCATYFYGTLWFAQEADHKRAGGSCGSWPRALARLDRSLVRLILSLPGLVYKDRVPLSPDQLWSSWFKAFSLRGIEREQLSQVKRDEPSWHLCHHLQRLQGKTLLWTDSSNKCSGTSVGKYVVNELGESLPVRQGSFASSARGVGLETDLSSGLLSLLWLVPL